MILKTLFILFNIKEYDTFRIMMEKRENVERLLVKIEELDAQALQSERQVRAARAGRPNRRTCSPESRTPEIRTSRRPARAGA
mgnify:CR=1 FL=1